MDEESAIKVLRQRQNRDAPPSARAINPPDEEDKPVEDLQLRKAIEYLERRIGEKKTAA